MKKFVRFLIYVLPLCLFFSYYPVMHFGASESMNFEISVPMIWLAVFDVATFILLVKQKKLFRGLRKKWVWLLLPGFLSLSVLWSLNSLRGLLAVGILWSIYFAVYAMFELKSWFKEEAFRATFWKWFVGSTLFVCGWCLVQCILDLAGVGREVSLMCQGCTYKSFGFPHPNGFAIEPQFMGNLLLAPAIVMTWQILNNNKNLKHCAILLFVVVATLFLTFSRGAIYAFIVAMIFMTGFAWSSEYLTQDRRLGRAPLSVSRGKWFRVPLKLWGIIIVAFLFTLNLQGIMAAASPTNDTYFDGISKALNHLSLGIIDIRQQGNTEDFSEETQAPESETQPVEKPVENSAFDGYVPESTETRVKLTDAALAVWSKEPGTILFGVGLGGAGQALYANGLTDSPKEIVQNQYASLLLESGLVGILLFILTMVLIIRAISKKSYTIMALSIVVAYGISLLFFAGLPNALQIYLLLPVIILVCDNTVVAKVC